MGENDFKKRDNYNALANEDPVSGEVFLNQVLDRFNIDLKDPVTQLIVRWKDIVGTQMAEHTSCERYCDGVLHLICDHPSRATQVRMNSSEIIKIIRGVFPEIDLKKIVTRVKPRRTT